MANINNARARLAQNPTDTNARLAFIATQLFYSRGIWEDIHLKTLNI